METVSFKQVNISVGDIIRTADKKELYQILEVEPDFCLLYDFETREEVYVSKDKLYSEILTGLIGVVNGQTDRTSNR